MNRYFFVATLLFGISQSGTLFGMHDAVSDQTRLRVVADPKAPLIASLDNSEDQCVICLDKLRQDLRALICGHVFHEGCIRKWTIHCPLCRAPQFSDQSDSLLRVGGQDVIAKNVCISLACVIGIVGCLTGLVALIQL